MGLLIRGHWQEAAPLPSVVYLFTGFFIADSCWLLTIGSLTHTDAHSVLGPGDTEGIQHQPAP